MLKKHFKKGFSLVELLVVITIIAILSVVAFTAVGGQTIKARNSKRLQDLGTIQQAIEIYYAEKGTYPDATGGGAVETTGANGLTKKYLSKLLKDPKKNSGGDELDYKYQVSGTGHQYQLAAVLEDEETGVLSAYVVTNSESLNMTGVGGCTYVLDGNDICLPYNFN